MSRVPTNVASAFLVTMKRGPLTIGNVRLECPVVLAPVDGVTDAAFRLLCRRYGAALCFTEMVPAVALVKGQPDSMRRLRIPADDHPLGVQLVGNDPGVMSIAAKVACGLGADLVDINAGCPSRRVMRTMGGAALLEDLDLLARVVSAVKEAVDVPVTVKTRLPTVQGRPDVSRLGKVLAKCGVDAITLHARTVAQGFRGQAQWDFIARLKDSVGDITVIGNGDVCTGDDAVTMVERTECDGVMVGRGAFGRPWVFAQARAALRGEDIPPGPGLQEVRHVILDHFDLFVRLIGEESIAARLFRKHVGWYLKGFPMARAIRARLDTVVGREALLELLDQCSLSVEAVW